MPPLFKIKLTTSEDLLGTLKELPARAKQTFKTKMRIEFAPKFEAEVNALMPSLAPGTPSSPFAFGTPRSKRYYFWLITSTEGLTDGSHWLRTGDIESSFEVQVSDRLIENLIRVINRHPKAKYLYGPWQVQGHTNTGWGEEVKESRRQLGQRARVLIIVIWRESLTDAMKGMRR